MTAIRTTTDQRLDQVALQMQDMMTMIGRLVSSEIPALHPESLPAGTNAKAQAADWSGLEWESTDQREPWRGPSRLFRRSVGSLCKVSEKGFGSFKLPRAGATSKLKGSFVPADVQRQQVSKREQLTYGSSRGSHNKWPKRDADVDSNTLWQQEQVLSILEQILCATEVYPGRKTREQPRV